ncbi:MAG: PIN domain-containing protein [Planctomycetia bacterium]|nr:PIN domain-containing protein [Planctomycetia bacterium]
MIFVDTGAWYALLVNDDPDHQKARAWVAANRERLVLTDYILDETLTLLRARGQKKQAITFGYDILDLEVADFYLVSLEDIESAWDIFQKYSDKEWSFTDCTSKVAMERLGITTAFAFDQHFRQFGNVVVVP